MLFTFSVDSFIPRSFVLIFQKGWVLQNVKKNKKKMKKTGCPCLFVHGSVFKCLVFVSPLSGLALSSLSLSLYASSRVRLYILFSVLFFSFFKLPLLLLFFAPQKQNNFFSILSIHSSIFLLSIMLAGDLVWSSGSVWALGTGAGLGSRRGEGSLSASLSLLASGNKFECRLSIN